MKGDGDNVKSENSNDKDPKKNSEQAEMNAISAEVEATIKSGNQSAIDALKAKLQRVQGLGSIGVGVASNVLESYVDKEKEEEQRKKQSGANISSSPAPSYTNYQKSFNMDVREDATLLGAVGVVADAGKLVTEKTGITPEALAEARKHLKNVGSVEHAKDIDKPSKGGNKPETIGKESAALPPRGGKH